MKKLLYTLAIILVPSMAMAQTTTENYIKNTTYQVETTTGSVTADEKIEAVTYFDGLGRPMQSVAKQAGGNKQDVITPMVYDGFGRQAKGYLPYARTTSSLNFETSLLPNSGGTIAVLDNYYASKFPDDLSGTSPNPFSEKHLESSPLSRVLEQGAPGEDWAVDKGNDTDHTIKFEYTANTESDHVRKFSVSFLNGDTEKPQLEEDVDMVYAPSSLYKTVTKDENWQPGQEYPNDHTTEEYKDKQGRVVLKRTFDKQRWLDTYYVYDDYGNLTFVIPPKVMTYHSLLQPFIEQSSSDSYDWNEDFFQNSMSYGNYSLSERDGTLDLYLFLTYFGSPGVLNDMVIELDFSPQLPDMLLGNLTDKDANGNTIVYGTASIQNGDLHLDSNGVPFDSSNYNIETDLVVNLTDYQANYSPVEVSNEILNGLCYQYVYDERNRLVEKKVPGKAWERIVYNKLDQPIMVQDGLLYQNDHWLVTLYDAFGRVAYTGLDEYNAYFRYELQEDADALAEQYVTKTSSPNVFYSNGPDVYYTDGANPSDIDEIYTINYYDDYNFDNIAGYGGMYGGWAEPSYGIQPITNPKGLATGSKVRVLDTDDWITTVNYYDEKGRLIYVYSFNDYLDTTDKTFYKLDFTGKVLETTTSHDKIGHATVTTVDKFYYDHTGRLTKQTQTLGGNTEVVVENHYDELGQLESKGVGGEASQNRLQTVDYEYNVRGWLKQINDPGTLGNSLFAFKLNYSAPGHGATALYNGNIAETEWRTANTDNSLKWYRYSYDALNRLTQARDNAYRYSVLSWANGNPYIEYDRNGNILSLMRGGLNESTEMYGTIDDLEYSYADNSNQLLKVADKASAANKPYGFKDGANTGNDYFYDTNGNMRYDANKGITNIQYNHLNLPKKVTFSGTNKFIEYIYDAIGTKLKKKVTDGSSVGETFYAGRYVYEGSSLKFFSHPEGYVDAENGYKYVYQYKDHLGNVRLSYSDADLNGSIDPSTEILQERNYYPFGLEHRGYNSNIIGVENNKWTYQGQELTKDLGLNVHEWKYRISDPAIGRFWQIDPLAEDYYHNGTYNFSENRVIDAWELEGLEARVIVEEGNYAKANVGHTFVSVGSGKNQTVYTYGRWAGTDASSGSSHSPLNNGPGVMVKLTGDEARAEISKYVNDYGAQVFELTNVDESQVQSNLESEFNKSTETPDQGKYEGDDRAHVIDSYELTSCNCTTKSLDAVESGNGNKPLSYKTTVSSPKLSGGKATVNMNIMSISPADLSKQLNTATQDSKSGVIDVTNIYKKDDE